MKFLKSLALSLLSFLLFLALSVFGLAYTVNSTALNPKFITSEINRLDISALTQEVMSEQAQKGDFPQELGTALVDSIAQAEPLIKEKISDATYSIYDYLLGKKQAPELALTLRNTVLSSDFIVSLVDKVDMAPFAKEFLRMQLEGTIPPDMQQYVEEPLDKAIDKSAIELKPWMKHQIIIATDPTLDYLLGESTNLNVTISLGPAKEILRQNLREAFLESPPPELAGLSQAAIAQLFDQLYQGFSAQMPSTFEINQSMFEDGMLSGIAKTITDVEKTLVQARQYISYFQLWYNVLIAFMIVLILGIILIHRQVKGATRSLGTTFLTYGAFEFVGILVAKYFAGTQLKLPGIPASLQTWVSQFSNDLMAPLQTFSLILLVVGAVLIIISFVYKTRQA